MKVTCECGYDFEAPDGVESAECPKCGAHVALSDDWIGSVDMEDLSLVDEEAEVTAGPAPKTEDTTPAGSGEPPARQTERPPGPSSRRAPTPVHGHAVSGESVDDRRTRTPGEPVKGGLSRLTLIGKVGPEEAVRSFESPARAVDLIAVGAILGVLLIFTSAAWSYLSEPEQFSGASALQRLLALLVELGAAALILNLLALLLRSRLETRPAPLGVVEGIALVRVIVLVLLAPILLILGLITLLSGNPPLIAGALTGNLLLVYAVLSFFGQAALVVPMLDLGCVPGLIVNGVIVAGSYSLADKVTSMLA